MRDAPYRRPRLAATRARPIPAKYAPATPALVRMTHAESEITLRRFSDAARDNRTG